MVKVKLKGKEFTIRELTEEDCKDPRPLLDFINQVIDDPQVMISLKDKLTLEQEKQWLKEFLEGIRSAKKVMYIVEQKGVLVSNAILFNREGRSDHVGEIGITIRSEEYRGIGLGRALMTELISNGIHKLSPEPKLLRLSVFANNDRAKALYEKLGFEEVARIPQQYEHGGKLVDEVIMLYRVVG